MSNGLRPGAQAAAGHSSDSGSLAATGEGADDGSNSSAASDLLGCILASRAALLLVLIGLNVVNIPSRRNAIQLKYQQRLSSELAGALHGYDMAFDVVAGRYGRGTVHGKGRVQCGMKGLTLARSF